MTDAEHIARLELYRAGWNDRAIASAEGVTRHAIRNWRDRAGHPPNEAPSGSKTLEERFWEKVDKRGPDECWKWQAADDGHGYGAFGLGGREGRMHKAHRVSYQFEHGDIPDDAYILHECDNPACVNPAHLYAGDQYDNMQDAVERDRGVGSPGMDGEEHPMHKLTESHVREIRHRYKTEDVSQYDLADDYGITQSQVWEIVNRKSWTHID